MSIPPSDQTTLQYLQIIRALTDEIRLFYRNQQGLSNEKINHLMLKTLKRVLTTQQTQQPLIKQANTIQELEEPIHQFLLTENKNELLMRIIQNLQQQYSIIAYNRKQQSIVINSQHPNHQQIQNTHPKTTSYQLPQNKPISPPIFNHNLNQYGQFGEYNPEEQQYNSMLKSEYKPKYQLKAKYKQRGHRNDGISDTHWRKPKNAYEERRSLDNYWSQLENLEEELQEKKNNRFINDTGDLQSFEKSISHTTAKIKKLRDLLSKQVIGSEQQKMVMLSDGIDEDFIDECGYLDGQIQETAAIQL